MEVKRIEWINDVTYIGIDFISRTTRHYDLHLIPGAVISPSLLKIYETDSPTSPWKWASDILPSDNVIVKFNPKIFPAPAEGDPPPGGDPNIKAWNMEINIDSGRLSVNVPSLFSPPPHRLYNFIVEATVTDKNIDPPNVITSEIRIHIHDSIKFAWLTPSVLSVRKNTDRHRFSILAEFNNSVSGNDLPIIGDISTLPGIKWERASGSASVSVKEDTGYLTALSDTGSAKIRAKLPAPFNAIDVREATVKSQKPWGLLPAKVEPVPKRKIIESSIYKVPNILFIPDGFKDEDGEKALFKELVELIVSKIRKNGSLMPFNLFIKNKKINFWRAFIPSSDVGASVLHYMTPIVDSNKRSVEIDELCFAVKPDIESEAEWTLQELIYVVGLPLWFDYDMPDNNETYKEKLDDWIARFNRRDIIRPRPGGPVESPRTIWKRKVNIALWRKWKKMGRYLLFNERDTALGISKGGRPNILENPHNVRSLSMHPFRTAREHLDMFLIKLEADGIGKIGKIWGFPDVTGVDRDMGKDREYVFVLCRGSPDAGARNHSPNPIVALSISRDTNLDIDLLTADALMECEIVPHELSADMKRLSPDLVGTIIHEMAHIFPLNDEYGGQDSMPETDKDQLIRYGNTQHRSDLVSAVSPGISSRNIKWRWHRIEKVGVLAQNPTELHPPPPAQKLHIKLEPGQARRFLVGEHLFLRQRPLIKNPPSITSPELEIVDPENRPIPIDTIEVKVLPAGETVKVVDFPGGILPDGTINPPSHNSILFKPRPSTVDPAFELVVHKKILNQIDNSGGPLNAFNRASGNALRDCVAYVRTQKAKLDFTNGQDRKKFHAKFRPPKFPPNFLSHKIASINQSSIIGLYESGSGYYCNVYHPAGMCLMITLDVQTSLCHVCRYILVDIIDPLSHGKLDATKAYNKLYSRI